jgi:hypothetical protein
MAENQDPSAEQVVVPTEEGKTETFTVVENGRGVLMTGHQGEDVHVQPESVPVWLDRGYKLKK